MQSKFFGSQNNLKYPKINKKGKFKTSRKILKHPVFPRRSPIQVLTGLVVA